MRCRARLVERAAIRVGAVSRLGYPPVPVSQTCPFWLIVCHRPADICSDRDSIRWRLALPAPPLMPQNTLLYLFDPLCGWCYGAAPALDALTNHPSIELMLLPSGLFAGRGARPQNRQWADYAWANDQRIAALTGQVFSEAYRQQVLLGPHGSFDSGPMTRALTLARGLDRRLELALLHHFQRQRYIDGRETSSARVAAAITSSFLERHGYPSDPMVLAEQLDADDALALLACERINDTKRMMESEQVRGVPKLYLETAGQLQPVSPELLYQGSDAVLEAIAVMPQMRA